MAGPYYPMMVDLHGRTALIVGGGPIAARKAEAIIKYGARVTIVAIVASDPVRAMAERGEVTLHERAFEDSDLDTPWMVFAATNDRAVHEHIKEECERRRIWCNIVDVTDLCAFIVPSIIRRGELMVTISTDGMCPAYSKFQRKRMEQCCFFEGAERFMHVIAAARWELKGPLGEGLDDEEKFELLNSLIQQGELHATMERDGVEAAKALAKQRIEEIVRQPNGHNAPATNGACCGAGKGERKTLLPGRLLRFFSRTK
ncbi:MAG: bifunctional precorrin-2 dehydrogenase/sirohydrochlorin ferrochelatase [Sumerlaeia bacterium]